MSKQQKKYCCVCGAGPLVKDMLGINKKLLGTKVENFYCLECLATYLDVESQAILDKIEEFKDEGCKLFA